MQQRGSKMPALKAGAMNCKSGILAAPDTSRGKGQLLPHGASREGGPANTLVPAQES